MITVLQSIWSALPQENIDKAILQFRKRLSACVKLGGTLNISCKWRTYSNVTNGPFQGPTKFVKEYDMNY